MTRKLLLTMGMIVGLMMGFSNQARALTVTDTIFDRKMHEQDFAFGADVSFVSQMESWNTVWRNKAGVAKDILEILKEQGINNVRLRVWVNPGGGWCGKNDVVKMAKRAHAKGMGIMLCFHYSDTWADPGTQERPAAWKDHSGIRDYEQNAAVMMALANNPSFRVAFVGRGEENADVKLKELAEKNHVTNVHFQGYYEKKDEPRIVQESTFLNIFYPRKLSHDTALSNRFYNSLIFRKPMITTANTIQGDYAAKYGVGIAIDNTDQLGSMLETYVKEFDASKYETNRNQLLQSFKQDYDIFKKAVVDFATQQ